MPDGRMLAKSIAWSEQIGAVSLEADYLFTRMIPHLDSAGRMVGSPKAVKAMCCPLRDEITAEVTERALSELATVGLLSWYRINGHQYIEFPTFAVHQRGARLDREAPSRIPSPSGSEAEVIRSRSGVGPELVRASEVKLREVKLSEIHVASDDATSVLDVEPDEEQDDDTPHRRFEYPPDFEEFWTAYPQEARGTKKTAWKAYRARQREGHTHVVVMAGLARYLPFLAATGRYAKNASTFVGPDLHFLEPWEIPRGAQASNENAAQRADRESNERKHRAMLVESRKQRSDGDDWWARMERESAASNINVWAYAYNHRDEAA